MERTAPVEVFVRRGLGKLATVLLHTVMHVLLMLTLDLTDPEDAGGDCVRVNVGSRYDHTATHWRAGRRSS